MPNLFFRGQRELSTGLQLQQKDHHHMAGNLQYLLSRATYIAKCWRVAKMINFVLNFFPCLPDENPEKKLGE